MGAEPRGLACCVFEAIAGIVLSSFKTKQNTNRYEDRRHHT